MLILIVKHVSDCCMVTSAALSNLSFSTMSALSILPCSTGFTLPNLFSLPCSTLSTLSCPTSSSPSPSGTPSGGMASLAIFRLAMATQAYVIWQCCQIKKGWQSGGLLAFRRTLTFKYIGRSWQSGASNLSCAFRDGMQ